MIGLVSPLAAGHDDPRLASGPGGGTSPPPCPPVIEILCDSGAQGGGSLPAPICLCGPGAWVQQPTDWSSKASPLSPQSGNNGGFFTSGFAWQMSASAFSNAATVSMEAVGQSRFGGAASIAKQANAYFNSISKEIWDGATPACPRVVNLAATGGAALAISVSTSANPGCSAASTATAGGGCSSLGNANAELGQTSITANAQFNSASGKVKLAGNIGASVSWSSPSIQGSFSKEASWEVEGSGSAAGSASYAVKPDRTYCAFTNRAITRRAYGSVAIAGSGTVAADGSSAFAGGATISMSVN